MPRPAGNTVTATGRGMPRPYDYCLSLVCQALRSTSLAPPNNLPARRTQLIGRSRELNAIRRFLLSDEVRLLTLTGPAGIGKTRLAQQVATGLLDEAPPGTPDAPGVSDT